MDSNYSVLKKSWVVELTDPEQRHPHTPKGASLELMPFNGDETGKPHHVDREVDDDDIDFDDLPLIFGNTKADSGTYGAVFNLTTSIVGAGIMALPNTMKVLGLILGLVLIVLIGVMTMKSIELLVRYTAQLKASSYGEVVDVACGKTARVICEICIIVNNAGVLIVYLIIMGDVMSGSLHHIGVFDQWLGNGFWDHRKVVILVVLVVCLAPLCALEKIDSLSLTSAASVALAVIFVLVASVVTVIKLVEGTIQTPRMGPDFGSETAIWDLLVVIPIMTNAYVCHFNVPPIYNELEGKSPQKMDRVGRITTALCVAIYATTAVSGYLLFGDDTESDILTNFDKDLGIRYSTALNYIVRVGYILHLILVFPVIHFSLRQTVDALLFEGSAPLAESRKRSLALTVVLLALIYIGSTMIPNIWTAFKLTGATTAVSLGFIFPALVALRLRKHGHALTRGETFLSWFMLVLAIIVSIVGVIGNIYSISSKSA